jgi:hypothetical protein
MRRRLVHGAVAGALLCVMGCSFSRGTLGDEFNAAQIVTALGAPDRVLQMNGQELFQYYRYDAKAASLLLILVNIARLNIKSDDLFIWFNRDGVVHDVIFGKRTDTLTFKVWPGGD